MFKVEVLNINILNIYKLVFKGSYMFKIKTNKDPHVFQT